MGWSYAWGPWARRPCIEGLLTGGWSGSLGAGVAAGDGTFGALREGGGHVLDQRGDEQKNRLAGPEVIGPGLAWQSGLTWVENGNWARTIGPCLGKIGPKF